MPVNLNQYRGTVGVFHNCKNIYCNSGTIYYNKAQRIYSSFLFFRVIFLCGAYLFSLIVCLLCVMWNLFTVGSLQFSYDSTIASLQANQNRPKIKNYVNN